MGSEFTEDERAAMGRLGEFLNEFKKLPTYHSSDLVDVNFHVHAIQNILMARVAVRSMPDEFVNLSANG